MHVGLSSLNTSFPSWLSQLAVTIALASKRVLGMHHTVRCFKDSERGDIDRYAGTSSIITQKVLVSEAV